LVGKPERFRRLVVDLIDISRHDSGAPAEFEQIDVGDLVRQAADAGAGRPATTVAATAEPLVMVGDKRRLERVFANLVENADQHGGGCQEVVVRRVGAQVEVRVDDAGPGVPPRAASGSSRASPAPTVPAATPPASGSAWPSCNATSAPSGSAIAQAASPLRGDAALTARRAFMTRSRRVELV
jgi:hypothetical protein